MYPGSPTQTCPVCKASNPPTATWCAQCLAPLRPRQAQASYADQPKPQGAPYQAYWAYSPAPSPPPRVISNEDLTRERNIYLGFWAAVLAVNIFFGIVVASSGGRGKRVTPEMGSGLYGLAALATIASWVGTIYVTYRLAKFLGESTATTIVLCILSVMSCLYLIPIIYLLVKVRETRQRLRTFGPFP